MSSSFKTLGFALMIGAAGPALAQPANLPPPGGETPIAFDVHEGTSMAVSASPDGKWLAVDIQGSLWIIPAAGGKAKRITDYFNDARQPVWAPDGSSLLYFAYRDGGYDLWSIRPDGSDMHKITEGAYDDREPVYSPDGKTIAFSSDRSGNYDIWTMDVATGALKQISSNPREDRMPTWSPDGARIAYSGAEGPKTAIYATSLADGTETLLKQVEGKVDAPSFGPGGELAYVVQDDSGSHLFIDDRIVSGTENVFPFRISWRKGGYYYVSDGKIRHGGTRKATVEFTATLEVVRPQYARAKRDWDSTAPRKALGITHPRLSPDGSRIAFVALGDLYVVPVKGGTPENLTKDAALDADADWSPDGNSIVFSSDRVGGLPQLFIKDLKTGKDRQLTNMDTQPLGAAWSPDGRQVAFIDVDGRWGVAGVCVVDVATGTVTRLQGSLGQPGSPSWSADGKYVAISLSYKFSNSFREGTNQVYVIPVDGKTKPFWQIPQENMSLDTRSGSGPAWSPDGTKMAGIYEGLLKVWSVGEDGKPMGPARSYTSDIAFYPTWSGDSKTILFQSNEKLKTVNMETGVLTDVPVDLSYRLAKPTGRTIIHVGSLVDSVHDVTQKNKDIVIDGNRIVAIRDHDPAKSEAGARYVDASGLTAIPGLIEYHSHIQKDFGSNLEKAWLAYGITTVRDPGTQVYDAVEDREAAEAGVRISPRLYTGGPLLEWQRVYYKMGIAVSSPAHLERELARARALKYDIQKSYVRMPDIYQRRIVEAAHDMGIPVSGHEIFPAAYSGVDGTEHMGATSRRGYSPKQGPGGMAYEDVIQLFGKSQRTLTPTNFGALIGYLRQNPDYRSDPRVKLYPDWAQETVTKDEDAMARIVGPLLKGGLTSMKKMYDAGTQVVAGTDTMIATNLHAEIASYVDGGLTPFQALQTATVNSARALNLDAGTLEAGKLADIALIDGDPRENIANTFKVKTVVANGNVYTVEDLLKGVQ
ncbi:Tol biopolymer transport system component/imidazolonepropionase-like amidohydrolase [Sphingobium sp. OAS761]|uniref:LpqB family beta-propeller domain-containing protein n=1 Tax=Sphingobium sp. OAS761 TaxID=2817901 RepID=UPI00209F7817|nr:LpqB family beta-propeller domain-containing protein [Sphingobium sp. OAS761]MCP1469914.1 Tol biopolymer transport system component/imidazolonepropionase-like amidohydrolase [Sphingobium sp. OAS761]